MEATEARRYREQALAILRDLEAKGTLDPADRSLITEIELFLAGPAQSPS